MNVQVTYGMSLAVQNSECTVVTNDRPGWTRSHHAKPVIYWALSRYCACGWTLL